MECIVLIPPLLVCQKYVYYISLNINPIKQAQMLFDKHLLQQAL